ncbi:MAG TPA: PAS domain S-box protein [Anaerolineales bacterium]|nr:PAS domain S-box protein [Anaerolineales bacterium]
MNTSQSLYAKNSLNRGALRIAGLYLLIGGLWILFSDKVAERVASSQEMLTVISLYKGWGYVFVTALLLYWLIRRHSATLRAGEEQLQRVMDAMPAFISYVDSDRRYRFTNKAYEEWFGDTALGKHMEEVIGKKAYQAISKYVDRALTGETVTYETEISLQGSERFMRGTYVPDTSVDGRVKGFFVLVQDLTEQKQAQEELRQWADAFEGCAHGIAIGDPSTNRIVVCNPAFASMHKCRVEDIVGSGILGLYASADHEHVRRNVAKADQIGHARFEAQMIRRDGSIFPIEMDIVSVLGDDGEVLHRVATAQDISERKQAQKVLQESEERYRIVSELTSDYAYKDRVEADGSIIPEWITESFTRITGYTVAETQERGFWLRLLDPEDVPTFVQHTQKVLAGQSDAAEMRVVTKRGEIRWLRDLANPIWDAARQRVISLYGAVQDITEQKQNETALMESNTLFRTLFEASPDAILLIDPHGNWPILDCNTAACQMNGYTRSELVGQPVDILNSQPLPSPELDTYLAKVRQASVLRYETLHRRKDGTEFPIEVSTSLISPGGRDVLLGIDRDITERKRVEEELRKSEEKYRYLFENNPHPMWIYDRKTLAFLAVNEAAVVKYGYSQQEFLSMTIRDIRPAEEVDRLMNNLAQPRQPLERSGGWKHRLKDGTLIDVEITSHTLEIDGHESALVVAQDVTERLRAERTQQLERARWQSIVEGIADEVWMCDAQGNMSLLNLDAVTAMGLDTFKDKSVTEIYQEVDIFYPDGQPRPPEQSPLLRSLRGEIVRGEEIMQHRQTGKKRYRQFSSAPTRDANGTITGAVAIVRDITEKKTAEEGLRRFELLSANSKDIILFMRRADGRILEANTAALQAYGYSRPELLALTIGDLRAPDTQSLTAEQMARADAGGILFETIHLRKDGTTFPVEVSSQGATIGGVRTLISIVRDITERRQTEEALRESEEKFSVIYYKAPFAAALSSFPVGVIMDVNEAFERVFGFTKEEVLGKTSLELGINPDPKGRARLAAELQARGSVREIELTLQTKSRTARVFLMNIDLVSIGGQKYIFQTAQDITERKQAEAALQKAHDELELKVQERTAALSQANSLLQALMDNMPDHIYFKDTQSRFIRNSKSQANALGLSDPAQVVGKTDFDFFPHAAKAYAEEQEVMRSGKPLVDFEEWVVWPNGRETWVSTTKLPLRNSDGQTIGIFGISHDITERKRAEQAIQQLNADLEKQAAQLQASNKELEAFSYSVSHDLRAPLRAIDGYTRILVEDYEALLDEEGKRVCSVISAEARRMGQLIDDLLSFSRLGRKELRTSKIDMSALAASVFNELIKEGERGRIDFQIMKLPAARGDPSLIRQVWVNLLSNAIKFTSRKERAVIEVGTQPSKDELIYYVRDSGAGFDMEYANKLFGVFQRLHGVTEFDGTGVGLAIVQRVIHRHGGRVWAEGEVEKGATFYFALPRKENHHDG